jgi:hypothetical protein
MASTNPADDKEPRKQLRSGSRKRGNGEGTIYQDQKSGRWVAQATIQGKRKSFYGQTRKQAQTKLRQALSDAEKGIIAHYSEVDRADLP